MIPTAKIIQIPENSLIHLKKQFFLQQVFQANSTIITIFARKLGKLWKE